MIRHLALSAGLLALIAVWAGPLPAMARGSFAAHMTMHMGVVAVAAPLLALGLSEKVSAWPAGRALVAFPIAASLLDLVVVWGWHTPLAHEAARMLPPVRAAEQMSFLAVGLLLWLSAVNRSGGPAGYLAGAGALLFTAMHMTFLGVLIGLAQTPICTVPDERPAFGMSVIADQQLGGVLMLGIGGVVYLIGGLALVGRAMRSGTQSGERPA